MSNNIKLDDLAKSPQLILDEVQSALYQKKALSDESLLSLFMMQNSESSIKELKNHFSSNGLMEDSVELDMVLNTLKCQNIKKEDDGSFIHEYLAGIPIVASPFSDNFDVDFKSHKRIYSNIIENEISEIIKTRMIEISKSKNQKVKVEDVSIDVLNSILSPKMFKKSLLTCDQRSFESTLSNYQMPDSLLLEKGAITAFILPVKISFKYPNSRDFALDYGNKFNELFFDIDMMKKIENIITEKSDSYLPKRSFDLKVGMPFIVSEVVESYVAFIKTEKLIYGLSQHLKVNSPSKYNVDIQHIVSSGLLKINFFIEDELHHTFDYLPMTMYNHSNTPQDIVLLMDSLESTGFSPKVFEVDEFDTSCKSYFKPRLSLVS